MSQVSPPLRRWRMRQWEQREACAPAVSGGVAAVVGWRPTAFWWHGAPCVCCCWTRRVGEGECYGCRPSQRCVENRARTPTFPPAATASLPFVTPSVLDDSCAAGSSSMEGRSVRLLRAQPETELHPPSPWQTSAPSPTSATRTHPPLRHGVLALLVLVQGSCCRGLRTPHALARAVCRVGGEGPKPASGARRGWAGRGRGCFQQQWQAPEVVGMLAAA